MKKIVKYISAFLKEDFNFWRYFLSILCLFPLFYLQYSGILTSPLKAGDIKPNHYYAIFYSTSFFLFYLISNIKINYKQLIFIVFAIAVVYFNFYSKSYGGDLFKSLSLNSSLYIWFKKVFVNIQKPIALGVVLVIPYLVQKSKLESFYGITKRGFNAKPYLIMLLVMAPLIIAASFEPSFQRMYPRYRPGIAEEMNAISATASVGIFELTYGLRFIGVEMFWRGFLIIGGVLVFGRRAILPAACIYSIWHFGKPMGEAIGAFFGGYILGILAYRTGSIYGGIAIHYGVALLMEFAAWYQILYY